VAIAICFNLDVAVTARIPGQAAGRHGMRASLGVWGPWPQRGAGRSPAM